MNTLSLRNWPELRQWIQVVAAAVLGALVAYGYIDGNASAAIVAFVAAILPNALSVFNAASTLRAWFYTTVGAVQTLLVGLDVFTVTQVTPIANLVLAVLGVSIAVTHTPTPAGEQG